MVRIPSLDNLERILDISRINPTFLNIQLILVRHNPIKLLACLVRRRNKVHVRPDPHRLLVAAFFREVRAHRVFADFGAVKPRTEDGVPRGLGGIKVAQDLFAGTTFDTSPEVSMGWQEDGSEYHPRQ